MCSVDVWRHLRTRVHGAARAAHPALPLVSNPTSAPFPSARCPPQCNLMVFSAGNYRTMEFVRFGVPFQVGKGRDGCAGQEVPAIRCCLRA